MNRSKRTQKVPKKSGGLGSIRIIGGDHRGRKLPVMELDGLRPTSDRVRETVFNWLQFDIAGARCLDLFSGSGALAFEALSRGASFVQMCELNSEAAQHLQQNIRTLALTNNSLLHRGDALLLLDQASEEAFDIVFIDPPFHKDMVEKVMNKLFAHGFVHQHSIIYLELEKTMPLCDLPQGWEWIREKNTSQVRFGIAKYQNISTKD